MDPQTTANFLEREWEVIEAAPFSFFGAVIAVGILIWAVIHFAYKSQIRNKDSEISLLDRQLKQAEKDIKAFQKPVEPKRTAEVVRHWPEPLMRTFKQMAGGEHLTVKVHPQTPSEIEQSLTASYLVSVGLADVEHEGREFLTVGSSASAGLVLNIIHVEGDEKKTGD